MNDRQKRITTHPDRTRRQSEAAERQAAFDGAGGQFLHGRQGRKARDGELDPALYEYDQFGNAARKPVTP